MKFELENYYRNISDDILIEDLVSVAKELGKNSVTHEEYDLNGKYGVTTYRRRFGSWFNALEKAGLQKTRTPANIPEEDLFKNLEEIWIKLGRQPRYREIQKPLSKYHAGTYENRFGTWRKALEKFIDFVNKEEVPQAESKKEHATDTVDISYKRKTKRQINWRLRFIIMKRDNFRCKICGQHQTDTISLEVDHILPWSKGGETIPDNLQTLCFKCNLGKSNLEM